MPLLRRITALVASLLLLQLTLAAGLDACAEAASGGTPGGALATAGTTAVAGMPDMPGMPSAPEHGDCAQHAPPASGGHTGMPSHCVSMVTCTAVIVASVAEHAGDEAPHSASPAAAPAGTVISRTEAPELPPPRA